MPTDCTPLLRRRPPAGPRGGSQLWLELRPATRDDLAPSAPRIGMPSLVEGFGELSKCETQSVAQGCMRLFSLVSLAVTR